MRFIKISKSNFRLDCFALSFCMCMSPRSHSLSHVVFSAAFHPIRSLPKKPIVKSLWNTADMISCDVNVLFVIVVAAIACGQSSRISKTKFCWQVLCYICIVRWGLQQVQYVQQRDQHLAARCQSEPSQNNVNREKKPLSFPHPTSKKLAGFTILYNEIYTHV